MQSMISLGVEHPDHNHIAGFNPIKDFVVETKCLQAPKAAVIKRMAFGRDFKHMKRFTDFVKELTAQIWLSRFIPLGGLAQVCFGFGANNDAPNSPPDMVAEEGFNLLPIGPDIWVRLILFKLAVKHGFLI
jgi:hypothetical protein